MGRELEELVWRRSRSCSDGECVEAARTATGVAVRDSTQPHPLLAFPAADWNTFVAGLRDGQLRRT